MLVDRVRGNVLTQFTDRVQDQLTLGRHPVAGIP